MEEELITVTQLGPAGEQFYSVATWVVGILGVLLAVALFYLILILRDTSFVSRKARETSSLVHEYVRKPVGVVTNVFSTLEGAGEFLFSQVKKHLRRRPKKSSNSEPEED